MNPLDYALLAKRAYTDAPTVGKEDSASRMHIYDGVHVFRGTDNAQAILDDVRISTVFVEGLGNLHSGFYSAVAALLPACLTLPKPEAIVGHSLGAAMAIIYAGVWALMGESIPVYAFEPPRMCADEVLADLLKAKDVPWYACRNGMDLVTQVPIELILPGPLTRIGQTQGPFDHVSDHDIDRVIEALQA